MLCSITWVITWDTIRNDLGDLRRLAEIAAAKL
jgi:hypothetical protein